MKRNLFFALLASIAFTSIASAQERSLRTSNRVGLVFGGEFGGESDVHADGDLGEGTVSLDLDPSIAAGLRLVHPMQTYVTLAAELRFIRWRNEDAEDRNTLFDFSVMPAARYVFDLGSVELEPYLGLPLGLTVNLFNEDLPDVGKGSVGFHIGLFAGITLQLPFGLGIFLETGWLHHQAFDKGESDTRYRLVLNQAVFHAGLSYAF